MSTTQSVLDFLKQDLKEIISGLIDKNCLLSVLQVDLSVVLRVMSTEAVRKICCVFKELFTGLEKEAEALRSKVKHLESELNSQQNSTVTKIRTQTVHKTKTAGR